MCELFARCGSTYTHEVFTFAYDIIEAAVVLLFSGETNDDGDYERYIASFQKLDRSSSGRDSPIAFLIIDPGNALPNALWRKRIAEASASLKSKPMLVMVSTSALARGVVRAIQWVHPLPLETQTASDLAEAVRLAEQRRGRPIRGILALEAEAREAARERARSASRANSA